MKITVKGNISQEEIDSLRAPVVVRNNATGETIAEFDNRAEAYGAGYVSGVSLSGRKNNPVYQKADGTYTTNPNDIIPKVELDEATGNIKITAPADVANDPEFQAQFEALKDYSKAYKLDNDYQLPKLDENGKETGETMSIKEAVDSLNVVNSTTGVSPIQSMVNDQRKINEVKQGLSDKVTIIDEEGNISKPTFSNDDIVLYTTQGSISKISADSFQAIPDSIAGLDEVKALPSYNATTHTVNMEDFAKWYSLVKPDDGSVPDTVSDIEYQEQKEDEFMALYSDLEKYLDKWSSYSGSAEFNPTEYAAVRSLYDFMTNNTPVCNFFQGASKAVEGFAEGVFSWGTKAGGVILGGAVSGVDLIIGGFQDLAATLNPKFSNAGGNLSTAIAELTGNGASDSIWEIVGNANAQVDQALKYGGDYVMSADYDADFDYDLYSSEEVGRVIGYNSAAIVATIALGNAAAKATTGFLAKASGTAAYYSNKAAQTTRTVNAINTLWKTINGAKNATQLDYAFATFLTTMNGANLVSSGARTLASMLGTTATSRLLTGLITAAQGSQIVSSTGKVVKAIGSATADIMAQGLADVVAQDPEMFVDIMSDKATDEETKQYLWGTLVGEAIGVSAGRGLIQLGKTTLGRTVSVNTRNFLWRTSAKVGNFVDSVRATVLGKNYTDILEMADKVVSEGSSEAAEQVVQMLQKIDNPDRYQAAMTRRIIRNMKAGVANSTDFVQYFGRSADDVIADLNTIDEKVYSVLKIEESLDDLSNRGVRRIISWFNEPNNPNFYAANEALEEVAGQITKFEKANKIKVSAGNLFSQDTSNYIGAKIQLPIMERALRAATDAGDADLIKRISSGISHWQEYVDGYVARNSSELVALADDYVEKSRKWYFELNDILANDKAISRVELADYRASAIFGDNGELYARTQRKANAKEYNVSRVDGNAIRTEDFGLDSYDWGSTKDFVDPNITARGYLMDMAMRADRNNITSTYRVVNGSTVVADAAQTDLAKNAKRYVKDINNAANTAFDEVIVSAREKGLYMSVVSRARANARANEAFIAIKNMPVTNGEKQATISLFQDSEVQSMFRQTYGADVSDIIAQNTAPRKIDLTPVAGGEQAQAWLQTQIDDLYAQGLVRSNNVNATSLRVLRNFNQETDSTIARLLLANNAEFTNSSELLRRAAQSRKELLALGFESEYADAVREANDLARSVNLADGTITEMASEILDNYKLSMAGNESLGKLTKAYSTNAPDALTDYIIAETMHSQKKRLIDEIGQDLMEELRTKKIGERYLTPKEQDKLVKSLRKQVGNMIDSQYNASRSVISETPELSNFINRKKWQAQVYETASEIDESIKDINNVVAYINADGAVEYIEVDPLLATFLNIGKQVKPMTNLGQLNYLWMKVFRLGTTTINPVSWVNQTFRDSSQAWVLSGINHSISANRDELIKIFGNNIDTLLAEYSDDTVKALQKISADTGVSVAEAAVDYELGLARSLTDTSTETAALRAFRRNRSAWYANGGGVEPTKVEQVFDKTVNTLDGIGDKLGAVNEARERYMRNLVYANKYSEAVKAGKSIEQARTWARYYADNATTNFNRSIEMLGWLQNSVPYLRAAVNGTKSFYRLWSLDPVGVAGRLIGGAIMPTMALTAVSLSNEENRKIYRQIPEYAKETSLPIVINGQAFSIPLPPEVAAFIAPARRLIERAYGAQDNSMAELMANDILALSPIELTGFVNLDYSRMFEDSPSWTERIVSGVAKLFSQVAPRWAVSAATAVSGYDLYTGKKIDTTYITLDYDTLDATVVDYTSGALANLIHSTFPELGAPIAQEMLESIFGTAGVGMLDFLVGLGGSIVGEEDLGTTITNSIENLVSDSAGALTIYTTDQNEKDWKAAITELYALKEEILSSAAWREYQTMRRNATTDEDFEKVKTTRSNLLKPLHDQIRTVVSNLVNNYGGITSSQFGSVISLMTINVDSASGNALVDSLSDDIKTAAKRQAIQTMVDMGFPSTTSGGGFGQYVNSATGPYISYTTPLEILNLKYTLYSQSDMHVAQITNVLERGGISRSDMFTEYYAATNSAERKQAKANWNKKVIEVLAPYVERYGVESIIDNSATVDFLERYIFVDNPYTAKEYIRSIFVDEGEQ